MLLSAAHRNVILLPLVFLSGVWVGQSRLNDQKSDGQDNPRRAEIRSELERRASRVEDLAKSGDNKVNHFGNANATAQKPANSIAKSVSANSDLDNSDPSWENSETEPIQELSDILAPSDENGSESYSVQEDVALESTTIEPSPQSIEDDIVRSLEEAGIPTEEIPGRVENVMGMILQENQQTPEAYPSISSP